MKVLISISDERTFDNYALFKDSVLHKLIQDPENEVVVLVSNKIDFNVDYSLSPAVVEHVQHNYGLSSVQRVVQFLYSYLLYTNTTYLVSSLGARNDKPRTRTQELSHYFKKIYNRLFGGSGYLRNVLSPNLYEKFFKERPYKEYFEKYNPDVVFLPNICRWPADIEILAEAKRQGVKSVGVPRNWDHMSKYFVPFKPDRLCVWGSDVKEEAIKYQRYAENDVVITGSPQVDFMVSDDCTDSKADFIKRFRIPENYKIVLYASQGPYSVDAADYVDMMIKAREEGFLPKNTFFILRPYPGIDYDYNRLACFGNREGVLIDSFKHEDSSRAFKHLSNVLKHSDVVVTSYSSVVSDSAIFDTPCIVTNFDGYSDPRPFHQSMRRYGLFTHMQDMREVGAADFVESRNELVESLNSFINNPELKREERKEVVERVFYSVDGLNSNRVTDEIYKMAMMK